MQSLMEEGCLIRRSRWAEGVLHVLFENSKQAPAVLALAEQLKRLGAAANDADWWLNWLRGEKVVNWNFTWNKIILKTRKPLAFS